MQDKTIPYSNSLNSKMPISSKANPLPNFQGIKEPVLTLMTPSKIRDDVKKTSIHPGCQYSPRGQAFLEEINGDGFQFRKKKQNKENFLEDSTQKREKNANSALDQITNHSKIEINLNNDNYERQVGMSTLLDQAFMDTKQTRTSFNSMDNLGSNILGSSLFGDLDIDKVSSQPSKIDQREYANGSEFTFSTFF